MTVFARLASGQGYARAALLNLSLCLAFLLVGSSEAASSSSSSTETGMVGKPLKCYNGARAPSPCGRGARRNSLHLFRLVRWFLVYQGEK